MTTTILTRPAADALGNIHDRTQVIVPEDLQDEWPDPGLVERRWSLNPGRDGLCGKRA